MNNIAPAQQLLAGIATDLTVALPGADGEPEAGLTVAVTVTRADGTVLYTDAATTDNDDGTYSLAVTDADLATLDLLVATWKVSSIIRATTAHEIVGGFYFTRADVDVAEAGRAATDLDHMTLRAEVEAEAERITGVSFVPRYMRCILPPTGSDELLLPNPLPRIIRSVRIYSEATTYTALSAGELASIVIDPSGLLQRRDGGRFGYPSRLTHLIVEWEHGYDRPPADVKRAAMRRYRTRSHMATSGVPDRAVSFTAENGATYRLATAGELTTGDPDIDAIYGGYAFKADRFGIA